MASANLFLDKRSESQTKGFPVKIHIYHAGKQHLVSTKIFATENSFNTAFRSIAKSPRHVALRQKMDAAKAKADAILEKMDGKFDLVKFRRMFYSEISYQTKGAALFLADLYEAKMEELRKGRQFKHLAAFQSSLNSLNKFKPKIALQDVSVAVLKDYERWVLEQGNSLSTVFTYLRPLRIVFKRAIEDGLLNPGTFPFGRGNFVIGNSESARRALPVLDIKKLWEYEAANAAQQRAKDMWFFSFFCNGIAPIDVAYLTSSNLKGDHLIYQRRKTKRSKRNSKHVIVEYSPDMAEIVRRQGNVKPNPFLFLILVEGMSEDEQFACIEKWKGEQNKILRRIGTKLKMESAPCLYSARHSFADTLGAADVNIKTAVDALGQETIAMAMNYMGNARVEKVKQLARLTTAFKEK